MTNQFEPVIVIDTANCHTAGRGASHRWGFDGATLRDVATAIATLIPELTLPLEGQHKLNPDP